MYNYRYKAYYLTFFGCSVAELFQISPIKIELNEIYREALDQNYWTIMNLFMV